MDPTQNPPTGGQPQPVDLSSLEKMIGDLSTSVNDKIGEVDTKITELATENATLREYIAKGDQPTQTPDPNTTTIQPGWLPKSWDDFPALVDQRAREIIADTVKQSTEQQQRMSAEQTRVQNQIDKEIDTQLETLTKDKVLPEIVNPRDPNDPGNMARKELLALGVKLETPNLDVVARDVLVPAHEKGQHFDPATGTWVNSDPLLPGRYSPVGSSSSRTTPTPSGPGYDVIRKARSMDELVDYANTHGYGPPPPQQ